MHDMAAHGSLYMAHGFCLLWKPWLVTLHVGADVLTAAAYFAIPFAIFDFVRRRGGITFRPLAMLFVGFIALCGLTHVFGAITLWYPVYELEGMVKAVTAAVSLATAIVMFPLIPTALALPRAEELAAANAQLAGAIEEKSRMLEELEHAHGELERRVAERTAELAAANARLTSALRASGIVVFEQDADLRYSWVMAGEGERPVSIGRFDDDLHEPDVARTLTALKKRALDAGTTQLAEVDLEYGGRKGTWAVWVEPRFAEQGAAAGVTCVAVDITQRRENEQRMRDVMRELSHRSKNLLAIVAAIAGQTARTTDDVASFRSRFMERLQSLASTHDALVASDWRGADLDDLVEAQLKPYQKSFAGRLDADGPATTLSPHAAQYVSLALHELAANATKHGALAQGGRVRLRWERASDNGNLHLEWREQGSAPMQLVERRGFGRVLLEQIVPRAVNGSYAFEVSDDGLVYRLVIDVAHVLAAAGG